MTIENQSTSHVELVTQTDGVYLLILKDSSFQAIDDSLKVIDVIWTQHQRNRQPIMLLVESTTGGLPVGYALKQSLKMMNKYSNLPARRIALIINQTYMLNLIDSIFQIMRFGIKYRYFSPDKRDNAIEWLKELA